MARVELAAQAARDVARLGQDRARVETLLRRMEREPWPANIDVEALRGRSPWSRARVGDYRVIFRPLTVRECEALVPPGANVVLVARVVHRRDMERVLRGL